MNRLRVASLLAAVGIGCAESTAPPALVNGLPPDVALAVIGTWSLTSWNGDAVPALFVTGLRFDPDKKVDCTGPQFLSCPDSGFFRGGYVDHYYTRFTGGSVTLTDDGQFKRVNTVRTDTIGGGSSEFTDTQSGGYLGSVAGGSVTLQISGGITGRVTITGNAMTFRYTVAQAGIPVNVTDTWAYQRQP